MYSTVLLYSNSTVQIFNIEHNSTVQLYSIVICSTYGFVKLKIVSSLLTAAHNIHPRGSRIDRFTITDIRLQYSSTYSTVGADYSTVPATLQ